MIKQLVRGYIYFENKKKEEVEKVFNPFRFDEVKFKIFENLKINNQEIKNPGVFLNGYVNEKYTSENIVRLFRKLMKLDVNKKNADISIEREDELQELDKERQFNFYYALQFKKTEIPKILERFKSTLSDKIIFRTRDCSYVEGVLMTSLEVFSEENEDEKINNLLIAEKINTEKFTSIK